MAIRSLDMSAWTVGPGEGKSVFCNELLQCFASQGMAKITNHGLSDNQISQVFEWSRRFFALSEAEKSSIAHPPKANPNRGWVSIGLEKSSAITNFEKGQQDGRKGIRDVKESFDWGAEDDPLFENKWPEDPKIEGFRSFMSEYYQRCHTVHISLLEALEEGFRVRNLHVDLVSRCTDNISEARLNYYPAIDIKDLRTGKISRISEHTDFGSMTLLLQDSGPTPPRPGQKPSTLTSSVGGLEVEDQAKMGTYIPVEASSKTEMLVNIGDSLQRLTNDILTSVSHRVTIPVSLQSKEEGVIGERYSVVYFAKVNRRESLKPLAQFVSVDRPQKYHDMTAFEWNQMKLQKIYG